MKKNFLKFNFPFHLTILTFLIFNINFSASAEPTTEVETVPYVNLNLYIGKWYEIASIPQFFQRKCIANTSAEYSIMDDGLIKVLNSCDTENGDKKIAEGRAKVKDTQTNSKLEVTFVKIFDWIFTFGGKYWIIDLEKDYNYAVIGDPTRKYSWILSRTPKLNQEQLKSISINLKKQGYDTCQLQTSVQTDGDFKSRTPLCEIIKLQ